MLLTLGCATLRGAAQISVTQEIGGKMVECSLSGLHSDINDCGSRADFFAYTFIGSISAVKPGADGEKELQIVPEEVFSGKPPSTLTVQTSQAICVPAPVVGEKRLFYLRHEADKPIVLDLYGDDSVPIANATEQIATLRRLKENPEFGLLRGSVLQDDSLDTKKVPYVQVVAVRESDRRQFATTSASDGRYEFPLVAPGRYDVELSPAGMLLPKDFWLDVKGGSCSDLKLMLSERAEIGGRVRTSDGHAAADALIVLIELKNFSSSTDRTDSEGRFRFKQRVAGDYLLGVNFPLEWLDTADIKGDFKLPPGALLYPATTHRSEARVFQLTHDRKLEGIDFVLPNDKADH